jgi:hypothetical protein
MEQPIGPEVSIHDLVPGTRYYAFSFHLYRVTYVPAQVRFRGKFTEYYTNTAGYNMIRFHETRMTISPNQISTTGTQAECPRGLYLRIFEPHLNCGQSYGYYRVSRFTDSQKKELFTRYVLYKRRQYERGLTGSTPDNKWFPRDIVREISLRYLTNDTIGCVGQWKC